MHKYQHKYLGDPFVTKAPGKAGFKMDDVEVNKDVEKGATECVFNNVYLPEGRQEFEIRFEVAGERVFSGKTEDGLQIGPVYVTLEYLE